MTEQPKLKKFLSVDAAPGVQAPSAGQSVRKAEFNQTSGTIEVPENVPEGDAAEFLEAAGQDPELWEVTGFRRTEWGNEDDLRTATRFTFRKREQVEASERVDIDDLLALIHHDLPEEPSRMGAEPTPGAAVLIGDMQFGQGVDDPFEAIQNTLSAIDKAADELERRGGANELLVAWLGDHVEGFTSQGGKNTWRTRLTLSEQIRATRRVMYYAVERFHPLTERLVMAAIPGNHGRVENASGGSTRVDDNHDVEALNAVSEALSMSARYRGVECLVPQEDQLSLAVKIDEITWGLVHGDKWRPGKHFEWWREQAFHGAPVAAADILAAGHYHYLLVHEQGVKLYIQVPTLGTDGVWWEHQHGSRPHPGLVLATTSEKGVTDIVPVRS